MIAGITCCEPFILNNDGFVSLTLYREKRIKYGVQHAVRLEVGISVGRLSTHCFRHNIRTTNGVYTLYSYCGWNRVNFYYLKLLCLINVGVGIAIVCDCAESDANLCIF